ncbi:MAG: NAD(P)H-quinone oxidoreductase [Lentisphaeria bacterium]|nr:NAD(P)H-quinone oxidoreductase [Lentisphaeria bacterium]
MKAMTLDEKLNFVWREVPDPVRKADEVLIEVHAAAVNRADLMQKDGCYASPPEWPQWCGLEVSGIVLEAPEGADVKAGDKVCALVGGGGYSEKIAVPAGMVVPIPEGMTLVEAASIPEVWCTVYLNLMFEAGGLKPGDVFYVQAGASGVGLAAIQLAKLMGAEVITTVGSDEKIEFVKKLGADYVVDHHKEDIRKTLEAHPPAVALDCIGGKLMGECLKNMVFGGRWIMIATMAGGETLINLETIWRKRIKLIGSTLRSRTAEEKSRIMKALQTELWPLFTAGKLVSNIHAVFPIAQVEEAHAVLRRSENIGKVVLTMR